MAGHTFATTRLDPDSFAATVCQFVTHFVAGRCGLTESDVAVSSGPLSPHRWLVSWWLGPGPVGHSVCTYLPPRSREATAAMRQAAMAKAKATVNPLENGPEINAGKKP